MELPNLMPMHRMLSQLTSHQVPTDEDISNVEFKAEQIFSALKAHSEVSISQIFYAGSISKFTQDRKGFAQLFVFLSGVEDSPPIKEILHDWRSIIAKWADNVDVELIKMTNTSLYFACGDEKYISIIPSPDVGKDQEVHPIEAVANFLKDQSDFVLQVVRLGKHWSSNFTVGDTLIPEIVSALELVAVGAGISEEEKAESVGEQGKLMPFAFLIFLEQVAKIDELKLAFEKVDGKWKIREGVPGQLSPPEGAGLVPNYILEPTTSSDFSTRFKETPEELEKLKSYATRSETRLQTVLAAKEISLSELNAIFQPNPASPSKGQSQGRVYSDIDITYSHPLPRIHVWKPEILQNPEIIQKLKRLKDNLSGSAYDPELRVEAVVTVSTKAPTTFMTPTPESLIHPAFKQMPGKMEKMMRDMFEIPEVEFTTPPRHEDFMVTCTSPVSVTFGESGNVKVAGCRTSIDF